MFIAVAVPALAERPTGPEREEIKQKIRTLRLAALIDVLDLDEAGVARVMPVLNRSYDQIGDVTRDSGTARRELRALLASDRPDDAQINKLVERLTANKVKVDQLEAAMLVEVRKLLTAKQMGRLVVSLPEINHRIQQQIRRAAHPSSPPTGPDPTGGDPF